MMKLYPMLLVAVFLAECMGAETNAPLVMKGLYGPRSTASNGVAGERTYSLFEKGLRYLSARQHPDGSWPSSNMVQTTAFGLVAFLDHGETTASAAYGTNVIQSLTWVLSREPTNDWERVCLIHSLSAAVEQLKHPACLKRLRELLADLQPDALGPTERFIFQATRMPKGIRENPTLRPADLRAFAASDACPEILKLYFESSVAFHQGGHTWRDWNQAVLGPILHGQQPDGSFAMASASSPEEATIFTLLAASIYYHHNPWSSHWNPWGWPNDDMPIPDVDADVQAI